MKKHSILHAQEHLLYIHKTLDVPYKELISVVNTYRISPKKIAQYLRQLHNKSNADAGNYVERPLKYR